jgi:DNA-binding Lrp family transcriptional regulator
MVHAFVMVETASGESEAVRDRVLELAGVSEAHVVAGEYDVIAEVATDDVQAVLHTVSSGMQGLDGVVRTKTYISLDE